MTILTSSGPYRGTEKISENEIGSNKGVLLWEGAMEYRFWDSPVRPMFGLLSESQCNDANRRDKGYAFPICVLF